jgi:catechol 2,3-dioxygenase-like lactoylglutathione lyase family enzyme
MPYVPASEQLVVEIFVRDMVRATGFYRALGFELLRDAGTFVELTWEGHRLFLEERRDLPPIPDHPQANVRVMVADVDAWWKRARELGASVFQPIDDRDYGLRDFTILDLDGFGVRFGTRL